MKTKKSVLASEKQLKGLKKKKDWINVLSLISNWSQILIIMTIFTIFPSPITFILGLIVIGSRQFALAVLMHEGAHKLLFSNQTINDWVSQWCCAYPIFQDTKPYRSYHLKHHKFTETEKDPDLVLSAPFPITKTSFFRKVTRDLSGLTGLRRYSASLRSIFSTKGKNSKQRTLRIWDKLRGFVITNLLLFLLISTFLEWYVFFLLWWLPSFTYYSLIIRIRNIAEHAVVPGKSNLDNTRTTLCSLITGYLMVPHNVNYHLEHHLFISCPWYNLKKAHNILKENGVLDKMCVENSYFSVLKKATSG